MHFEIKYGKIWLQQNLRDRNPAEELVEMGVPREDIVLGLQPLYKTTIHRLRCCLIRLPQ